MNIQYSNLVIVTHTNANASKIQLNPAPRSRRPLYQELSNNLPAQRINQNPHKPLSKDLPTVRCCDQYRQWISGSMSLPSWFDGFASLPDALPRHEGI